jgi:tetratricopeptide (TPR) repeat protein
MQDSAFILGYRLFLAGKFENSIKFLNQSIQVNPQNADAYNHIGLCYDAIGKYDNAVTNYQKAISICERYGDEANSSRMKIHKAESLIVSGMYDEGDDILNELIDSDLDNVVKAQALSMLSTSLFLQNKPNDALELLKEWQMYLPDNERPFITGIFAMIRGRIYTNLEGSSHALLNFDLARMNLKNNKSAIAELNYYYGEYLFITDDLKNAIKYLKLSWKYFKKHKPSFASKVVKKIAEVYNKMGKKRKADSWLKKI